MLVTNDFILVHVPKTGGTFLNDIIAKHCDVLYRKLHVTLADAPPEYRDLPALAFIRNPWDWYVSFYHFMRQKEPKGESEYEQFRIKEVDFPTYMRLAFDLPHGLDYYSARVRAMTRGCEKGKFETLRKDFVAFLDRHQIAAPSLRADVLGAPRSNVGPRGPFRDYYDPETAELVGTSWVAKRFGYVFAEAGESRASPTRGALPGLPAHLRTPAPGALARPPA